MNILRTVLRYLLEREVTPTRIMQRVHRYLLDDDPNLESGLIYCRSVFPSKVACDDDPLPELFAESFYGRESIRIPAFIREDGTPVYAA
jgi:hypothetical protein